MKIAVPAIMVAILVSVHLRCAGPDEGTPPDSNGKDSLDIYAQACQTPGLLKENLYAIVYPMETEEDYWIAIADTVRMKELVAAWMPYVCNGLPDSLKMVGTEFLVDIIDETTLSDEGWPVPAVDLLNARLLSEHLADDPRNGNDVGTAAITASLWLARPGTYIIRNQEEWDQFSVQYSAEMQQPVDFDTATLIGIKRIIGGCWPGGHLPYRELIKVEENYHKLKVTTKIYGLCQVGYITWQWVTIPRLGETDSLEIEFSDVYIEESSD